MKQAMLIGMVLVSGVTCSHARAQVAAGSGKEERSGMSKAIVYNDGGWSSYMR